MSFDYAMLNFHNYLKICEGTIAKMKSMKTKFFILRAVATLCLIWQLQVDAGLIIAVIQQSMLNALFY